MPSIPALIQAYSDGPLLLRAALESAANVDIDARPIAGKWSVREVVCHLADAEIVYADRMKRVLAEDNPTFFDASPDLFVPALHCSERPLEVELSVIEAVRAHMLPILKSCTSSDFQRTGNHSLDGPLSLETLLDRIAGHVPHHIMFIKAKLACLK